MMISLIAVMVFALLKSLNLLTQVNQKISAVHEDFYRLEEALARVIRTLNKKTSCRQGCSITYQQQRYAYALYDHGEFACLVIRYNKKLYASHHWVVEINSLLEPQRHLIARIAITGSMRHCQSDIAQQIPSGLLSWHLVW